MSLDPQEEKLFMILQAIEQQGEQNKKTQANIEQIAQTVTEQQDQLAKDRAEFASDRQTFTRAMLQVEDLSLIHI